MYIVFEYMYALTCGASIGMHTCNVFPLFMKFDGPVKGVCVGGGGGRVFAPLDFRQCSRTASLDRNCVHQDHSKKRIESCGATCSSPTFGLSFSLFFLAINGYWEKCPPCYCFPIKIG